jgi:hypothetical protein
MISHFDGAVVVGLVIGIPVGWLLVGVLRRLFRT